MATHPEGLTQTDDVLQLVAGILGEAVVGTYLHGSAVLGRLRPGSDLDLLVVTRRTATDAERRALVAGLLAISGRRRLRPDDRPVELALVVEGDVRPWRYPPMLDFLYGEWLRDGYEAGMLPTREAAPDLAILLAQARAADRPVTGPPARSVLPEIPPSDVRRASVEGIPGLLEDLEPDAANVILAFARIWTTVVTGELRAKDAAAEWALERLPDRHRPVLARARDVYLGTAEDRWGDLAADLRPHADHVIAEIRRADRDAG